MKLINYGSLNIDYIFQVEQIVRPGQTIDSLGEQRFPGGKGLNQSLAIARAGSEVFHAGMIGEDGLFLRELLEQAGVDCRFLRTVESDTGKAFIQVDASGQNCIVVSGGANRRNTRNYCDQVLEHFEEGDMLLLQNEINGIDYLIDRAWQKGMVVALNPSPVNDAVLSCGLEKIRLFIMNEEEGRRISGQWESESILSEMERRYPDSEIVLTLGAKGAVCACRGKRIYQPSYPVRAVDTTGAGDTFTGYLLAHYIHGGSMAACLEWAAKAAAIAVSRPGAASAIPYRSELH